MKSENFFYIVQREELLDKDSIKSSNKGWARSALKV